MKNFEVKDTVFYMSNDKVTSGVIEGIVDYQGKCLSNALNPINLKEGEKLRAYCIKGHYKHVEMKDAFPTKEELRDYLFSNEEE